MPLGRETGRLALEDAAELVDVQHRCLIETEQQLHAGVQRVRVAGDDEGAVAAVLDHSPRLEHPERLPYRGAAGPERLRQLALGRQRVARLQLPLADPPQQLVRDQLVELLALDRLVAHRRLLV